MPGFEMTKRSALILVVMMGCGPTGPTAATVCQKNADVDQAQKIGDCTRVPPGNLFGERTQCTTAAEKCSQADRTLLLEVLGCAEKLPVCSEGAKEAWVGARTGCVMRLSGVSSTCNDAFAGLLPDPSGIFDGGVPDAGPSAINDGGTALDLVVVADETSIAFAWTALQDTSKVVKWAFIGSTDAGRDEPFFLDMVSRRDLVRTDAGSGTFKQWFLIGEASDGKSAFGTADAGAQVMGDAGVMCLSPLQCPVDRVCDLGQCRAQTCQPGGPNTCPGGYQCSVQSQCTRTTFDGGLAFDGGSTGTVVPETPLPFISNEMVTVVRAPTPGPSVYLGSFPAKRPDLAAIDSARSFVMLEQEGQLVGHRSFRRGRDYADDALTAGAVDTVGSRARVAWNAESRTLFACYVVGRGVRVRRSLDDGRTWLNDAVTLESPVQDDGGLGTLYSDCDIAAWRQGGALLVTLEDDALYARNVSAGLEVEAAGQLAFASALIPDAGPFAPLRPSVATLPSESMVHIVFTATRQLQSGLTDPEPYGVYRDGAIGTFTRAMLLTNTGVPPLGNPLPQDHATVAIDPKSKRAIAAYTSLQPGADAVSSIQVALWDPTSRAWGTGSDLSVFTLDIDRQTRILFPLPELQGKTLDAFSPVLAALPNGKVWLSMIVGPRNGGSAGSDFKFWAVPFDFEEPTPAGNARGWFKRPARKLSDVRAWDPRGGNVRPTVTAFGADSQISFSGVFTEGFGPAGDQEGGRAIFVTIP